MTVWKDQRLLATKTAQAAIRIAKGLKPPTTGTIKTKGRALEPAYLITPQTITKANWRQLITGAIPYLKPADVCSGEYKKYC
jgi:ABC-type xylose transport system substrate-binding protein